MFDLLLLLGATCNISVCSLWSIDGNSCSNLLPYFLLLGSFIHITWILSLCRHKSESLLAIHSTFARFVPYFALCSTYMFVPQHCFCSNSSTPLVFITFRCPLILLIFSSCPRLLFNRTSVHMCIVILTSGPGGPNKLSCLKPASLFPNTTCTTHARACILFHSAYPLSPMCLMLGYAPPQDMHANYTHTPLR